MLIKPLTSHLFVPQGYLPKAENTFVILDYSLDWKYVIKFKQINKI